MTTIRNRLTTVSIASTVLLAALAAPALAGERTVALAGNAFVPAELVIAAGDTVTWVNDGGFNNVVAGDGSFYSGPPSSDTWVYSHEFHFPGLWTYGNEQDPEMVGTVRVIGIFGDGFESGTADAWSATSLQPCNCYFSSDCAGSAFCDWGPGGFSTLDICDWKENKPNGVPGAGCDVAYVGTWIPDICDGVCNPPGRGSALGHEDPELLARGVRLWAEAMLGPAQAGGGPIDADLAARAMALPLRGNDAAVVLGRQTADLLVQAGATGFYHHFCHFEAYPDQPDPATNVDLRLPCAATAARLMIDATLAELAGVSGREALERLPALCPGWAARAELRCLAGESAVDCLARRARDFATFVTTPRADPRAAFGVPAWTAAGSGR